VGSVAFESGVRSSDFGRLLVGFRVTAGLSQEALAERARISVDAISALERGTRRRPRFDTVSLLATALGLEGEERRAFETASRPAVAAALLAGEPQRIPAAANNLPAALSRLVGRERELTEIVGLVRRYRLVTLTGTGGIGKTRTALAAAGELAAEMEGGVWLIELAPVSDPSQVAAAIASTLGIRARPEHSLLETLVAYFKHKTLLLLLDNCEHVVAEAARIIEELLRACPAIRAIATCREPLALAGEYTYRLSPLDAPSAEAGRRLRAQDAGRYGAIALFAERAIAADRCFRLSDDTLPIVAEICRRLDGIPLALELAAARVGTLPVHVLAAGLDERFALLTGGSRTALPRQQTLRALIDWSYALLDERERRCFASLATFAGRFTLEAAMHVCAERDEHPANVLAVVASLTDKSLLLREGDDTFRLLETTRYYAAEKLLETGFEDEAARRHLDYYVAVCEGTAAASGTGNGRAWLAQVRAVLDNVRSALHWSIDRQHDVTSGVALTAAFCTGWMALGLDAECSNRIETAVRCSNDETPLAVRARLSLARAQIAIRSQRSAVEPARAAVLMYESGDDERGRATALNALGYALSREGRCADADISYEQALVLAKRIGDVRQWGLALLNLGVNRESAEDFVRTREFYDAALRLGVTSDDDYLVGAANLDLSVLCEATNEPHAGYAYASAALAAFERAGDTNGSALALGNMTTNLIGIGGLTQARAAARDYVLHARTYRLDTIFLVALEKVAAIATSVGNAQAAASLLGFTAARAAVNELKRDPGNVRFVDGVLRQLRERSPAMVSRWLADGSLLSENAAAELALDVVSAPDGGDG
jgi:predicted ATPase/DNA-binding XRE family transcriptional regulator